jgi:hypothetical protein
VVGRGISVRALHQRKLDAAHQPGPAATVRWKVAKRQVVRLDLELALAVAVSCAPRVIRRCRLRAAVRA